MSVEFKSPVTSSNVNQAFLDKNKDTETQFKLALNRTGSGDPILDAQQAINDNATNLETHEASYIAHREFDTKANLDTWATTAVNGSFAFATDEKKSYQVIDGVLTEIGGGGGGISAWESATSYIIGNVVYYTDENIYRCIADNSDVTFTPTNWQELSSNFLEGYFVVTPLDNITYTDAESTKLLKKENYELYFQDWKDALPTDIFSSVSASLTVDDAVGDEVQIGMATITQSSASTSDSAEIVIILPTLKADWHLTPIKIQELLEVNGGSGTFAVSIQSSTDGISFSEVGSIPELNAGLDPYKNIIKLASDVTHLKIKYSVITPDDATSLIVHRIHIASDAFPVGQTTIEQNYIISQLPASLTNGVGEFQYNLATASIETDGDLISAEDDSANTRTKFVARKRCKVVATFAANTNTINRPVNIMKNGNTSGVDSFIGSENSAAGRNSTATGEFILESGEFFTVGVNSAYGAASVGSPAVDVVLSLKATAYADNVIVDAATFNADSYMRFVYGTGFGSTGTKIRRMTTQIGVTIGSDITYTPSSVNGDSWTLETSGIYTIVCSDVNAGGSGVTNFGLSLNASGADLSTNIFSLAADKQLGGSELAASFSPSTKSYTGYFNAGDMVRLHSDGSGSASNAGTSISISKIATPPSFLSLDVSSERENDYLATADRTTTNGLVNLSENRLGYIQSLTRTGTGIYVGVYKTGFFPTSPKSLATQGSAVADQVIVSIRNETATGFTAYVVDVSGVARDEAFNIFTTRGDADYRPPQAYVAGQVALTEARTDGVPYRTNKKEDGQWVWAVDYKTSATTSSTFTYATLATNLNVVDIRGKIKDNAGAWRSATVFDSGTQAWVAYIASTGALNLTLASFTITASKVTFEYIP